MERAEFEQKLRDEGYTEFFDREMEAGGTGPEHCHEFDALLFVLKGEMTIACNGTPETFRAGDLCSVAAGTPHTEQFGSKNEGVHYLAAWRYPAGAKRV
ncbi:MAG TPA: cupin domain-containing protein [Stellaceae bacterium]|nr:cupin domain-containing protein [Stellaceae bacterium]